jgi:beta-lactam-binding protein with PASTA domain
VAAVPELVGRHIDDATETLGERGLQLGAITYDPAAREAPGRITGQYPPAGYRLRQGSRVEVRVAGDASRVNRARRVLDGQDEL